MFYSFGSLGLVLSTVFLVGFKRQLKNMWKTKRRFIVIVYFSNVLLSIIVAIFLEHKVKKLILLILVLV